MMNLEQRLQLVQENIQIACHRSGRSAQDVRLLAVTKTRSSETIRQALSAGLNHIGENRVQEAHEKYQDLKDLPLEWAIIGHLQSNKVNRVCQFADEFHALDSLSLAGKLDRCLQQHQRKMKVYIQINTTNDTSRYGIPPNELERFYEQLGAYQQLEIGGLMTLAAFTREHTIPRQCFSSLRHARDQLATNTGIYLPELSMGMSGDYMIAIEEGATTIRLGQALFGPRDTPDSVYWPV